MAQTKPSFTEGIWATAPATSDTPVAGKVASGWTVETPALEWQNWWQNRADEMLFHVNDHGIPLWDAVTVYPLNAITMSAGIMYKSLQANNVGQTPATQPTFWLKVLGAEDAAALSTFLTKADNLNSVQDKPTSFNNIKQPATTTATGVVEEATQTEMNNGTGNKFPDCASVKTYVDAQILGASVLTGRVNGNGTPINLPSGWSSSRQSAGQYTISFGGNIGNNNVVLGVDTGTDFPITQAISERNHSNTQFQVVTERASTSDLVDVPFTFIVLLV